ncbi:MAG: hypothetical protein GY722_23180 [bacterium]|nr:hypothetical protein [bacterium]
MHLSDRREPKALAAIAAARGVGSAAFVRRIPGGTSATTDVLEPSNDTEQIVVRRHSDWSAEHDPDVANRETFLLQELDEVGVPVPEILWSGIVTGRPSVITRLDPGSSISIRLIKNRRHCGRRQPSSRSIESSCPRRETHYCAAPRNAPPTRSSRNE